MRRQVCAKAMTRGVRSTVIMASKKRAGLLTPVLSVPRGRKSKGVSVLCEGETGSYEQGRIMFKGCPQAMVTQVLCLVLPMAVQYRHDRWMLL